MFLVRLVYVSTISESFIPSDVDAILSVARKSNNTNNISGLLCFNHKYFLQCLEGSRSNVNYIYQKILHDKRHQNIMMLDYQEITEREFEKWSMGYIPESSLTAPIIFKYSGTTIFEPYKMTGKSAYMLMTSLRDKELSSPLV